jgi:hypothetical protein
VTAHIIEHRRYLVFRQLLDQPEQLLALHAHEFSVRMPSLMQLVIASCRRTVNQGFRRQSRQQSGRSGLVGHPG